MLVARPIVDYDSRTPRIISEIRKQEPITPLPHIRARISGDLLVICANETRWWPRRVTVRGGQLHVSSAPGEGSPASFRIPLRQLSLRAGRLPNSLSLCKGQNVILTLQTGSERAFDLWVKTIAIELIRQTPLDSVKYLDILSLAECWNRKEPRSDESTRSSDQEESSEPYDINRNTIKPPLDPVDEVDSRVPVQDEKAVEVLLKKCQNPEKYVPVKEKLVLFESLCRLGRKVRSTEDVNFKIDTETKRARSLHDLSSCFGPPIAVREICKYFENKNVSEGGRNYTTIVNRKNRRLINSDSQLNNVRKYQQNFEHVSCA